MHVTFLFIMHEGLPMLAFHDSVSDAWSELVRFVNESWPKRFGTQKPPEDEVKRARAYFRKDELYLVADTDLADIEQHIDRYSSAGSTDNREKAP
ncbi:hypothetical protein [Novosphingobium aquimarinum]|jgi:hypothetical protein|uniref:hypothetical protein n=1 Tax=Novosphingobium aquimarinum TaxID=2682494 RepID=UPI0012EBAD53|nr:hypothetical protein [Novosphingobium aquimarinum]